MFKVPKPVLVTTLGAVAVSSGLFSRPQRKPGTVVADDGALALTGGSAYPSHAVMQRLASAGLVSTGQLAVGVTGAITADIAITDRPLGFSFREGSYWT